MSRNLTDVSCAFCGGSVELTEAPRPITRDDARIYFDEYEGMIVASAECSDCHGKYLAWVDESHRKRHVRYIDSSEEEPPFHDLSFRFSFNDEPSTGDLYTIDPRIARAVRLRRQAAELEDRAIHVPLAEDSDFGWEGYRRP